MKFKLVIDEKVVVWKRTYVKVEANTLDEAVKRAKEEGVDYVDYIDDSEYIYETEEPFKDDNFATIEIMDENYNTLATNDPRSV